MNNDTLALAALAALALGGGGGGLHEDKDPAKAKDDVLRSFSARGFPQEEAAAAIDLESGWKPHALGSNGAAGLIQFMPATLRALGWAGSSEDFAKLSAGEQAPWIGRFVARAVKSARKWERPGDTYVLLAGPEFIGATDETVMYRKGTPAWKQNPTLREGYGTSYEGDITAGSVRGALLRHMGAIVPPPNTPGYAQPPAPPPAPTEPEP